MLAAPRCAVVLSSAAPFPISVLLRSLSDVAQASLCVRRAVYVDPETGKEDPAKKVGGRLRSSMGGRHGSLPTLMSFAARPAPKALHGARVQYPLDLAPAQPAV